MNQNRAARLLISGKVQGVCFRHHTCETARAAGVVGWVRNRADGRVEALVQGPQEAVDRMVAWCRQGPPAARVDDLQIEQHPCDEGLKDFEVRY